MRPVAPFFACRAECPGRGMPAHAPLGSGQVKNIAACRLKKSV